MSLQGSTGSTMSNLVGKVNGMSPNALDASLTIEGAAADAKATGEAIAKVDGKIPEVKAVAEKAVQDAKNAHSAADDAQETADSAKVIANKAQSAANSAEISASDALAAAENTKSNSAQAIKDAEEAMKAASKAVNAGQNAQVTADSKARFIHAVVTLTADGWSGTTLMPRQSVTIEGVLEDKERCYVQTNLSDDSSAYLWEQHDGYLVFGSAGTPDSDITVEVLALVQGESTPYREDFAEEAAEITLEKAAFEKLTEGHVELIRQNATQEMTTYTTVDEAITEYSTADGTDYIKCPKYLCLNFSDANARAYIYFYDLVEGEYVLNWDVVNTTSSTGVKNYLKAADFPTNVIEIPDNVYMRVAVYKGSLDLYGWDGEMFGMKLSADTGIVSADGEEYVLNAEGSCGITIPGSAKMILCKNAQVYAVCGMVGGVLTPIDATKRNFLQLPGGYDFYRMRLFGEDMVTRTGDVSDMVSIVVDYEGHKVSARAKKVLEACKKVCDLKWTPNTSLRVNSKEDGTYKAGVEYNGIPYGSNWDIAHYLGWHVSPHTFLNAVNDEKSVFYTEKAVSADGVESPFYSTVCSAFASMCDGWPYPQTNAGFVYDPQVLKSYAPEPVPGAMYTNFVSHVIVPEEVMQMEDEYAVNLYEATAPMCSRMTRFEKLKSGNDASGFDVNYGYGYFDRYGYVVRHLNASGYLNAPYADFDDVTVVGGSARPHRGDKSVYTSEDAAVYINLKGNPSHLYLKHNDAVESIPYDGDLTDVKDFLPESGIYSVYTDEDETEESFEYHIVEPVTYSITDGRISFSRNDWWYASCNVKGNPLWMNEDGSYAPKRVCVPADHSAWDCGFTSAYAVYYKGEYGAYAVSCTKV